MNEIEVLQFWKWVRVFVQQDNRQGQAMMNALYEVAPELYFDISGNRDRDCFYRDEKIPAFVEYLGI